MVLTCKSADKTQVCGHSDESNRAVLSCGTLNYASVLGNSKFKVSGQNPGFRSFKCRRAFKYSTFSTKKND